MDPTLNAAVSIALGIGLAAATGFRIFAPLLVAALAARAGWIPLNDSFVWLESTPALIALGTATAFETLAYFVPGVDHALDVIAGPAAVVAGVFASASVMTDMPPAAMWPLAIIAGGGAAGVTKAGSALVRAKTGLATAGLGNPVVSVVETAGAAGLSILAVLAPVLALLAVLAILIVSIRGFARLVAARSAKNQRAP